MKDMSGFRVFSVKKFGLFIGLYIFLHAYTVSAQSTDSALQQLVETAKAIKLSDIHVHNRYVDSAFAQMSSSTSPAVKAAIHTELAYKFIFRSDIASGLEELDLADIYAREASRDDLRADIYHARGVGYYVIGLYPQSLANYVKASNINSRLERKHELLKQYNNIALVHRELKNYDDALN